MKKLIYLFAITFIICGCTVHRFTTLESFDKPEYEVRDFDSTVTGIYDGTYNNVYDAYNDFSMVADSLIAMQLKTKNTFTVEAPFTVKVRARMHPASLALYCPLWIMPVEDAGGRIVSEFDIVESFGDLSKVVLSGHIGKNGYGNHKMYQKFIDIDPMEWHTYKMRVKKNGVEWFVDNEFMFDIETWIGKKEYYLWVSIIMSTLYFDANLPSDARMDFRKLKVIK